MRDEVLVPEPGPDENATEAGLRPRGLDEFVGQAELKEHLEIMLEAARRRGQAVDHLLFAGPPGLGKTTLAGIVANEMGVGPPDHVRAGARAGRRPGRDPHPARRGRRAVHRRDPPPARPVEEVLYPAMEDFQLDIVLGKGPAARSIRLDLPRVHARRRDHPHRAHHRPAARPLRARRPAGLLRPRTTSRRIVRAGGRHPRRRASSPTAPREIARRARGTPRIANRLLRRVRDFAEVRGDGTVDEATAHDGLAVFGVDERGLDKVDRAILCGHLRAVRRRTGRTVDAGHQRGRADRDGRGRLRAVPDP